MQIEGAKLKLNLHTVTDNGNRNTEIAAMYAESAVNDSLWFEGSGSNTGAAASGAISWNNRPAIDSSIISESNTVMLPAAVNNPGPPPGNLGRVEEDIEFTIDVSDIVKTHSDEDYITFALFLTTDTGVTLFSKDGVNGSTVPMEKQPVLELDFVDGNGGGENDRVVLPDTGSKKFWSADWEFVGTSEPKITEDSEHGAVADWLGVTTRGDGRVRLWYTARSAGTYAVDMRYFTGRTAANYNTVKWQGPNVAPGSVQASGPTGWHETNFEITVTEAGSGFIEFYNDEAGSGPGTEMPMLDYMTFSIPEIIERSVTIATPSTVEADDTLQLEVAYSDDEMAKGGVTWSVENTSGEGRSTKTVS